MRRFRLLFILAELGLMLTCACGGAPAVEVEPGLFYQHQAVRAVPWSIHVLRIDRAQFNFELVTTLGKNRILGLSPLSEQVRAIPLQLGRPLAAINGDFYRIEREPYAGDPKGLQIYQGELVSAPEGEACFWIDQQGAPHLHDVRSQLTVMWPNETAIPCGLNEERRPNRGVLYTSRVGLSTRTSGGREIILERIGRNAWLPLRPGQTYAGRVREVRESGNTELSIDTVVVSLDRSLASRTPAVRSGDTLTISTATTPDLSGARVALGAGPILVQEGEIRPAYDHQGTQRHPRSAIGWDSKHFFLVAVDGRQPRLSLGMNLSELAQFLVTLGCEEAMNLDGGGSVEMWVNGRVVNSPCYGYERATANSLVLLSKERASAP